jgi:4-hydroxy-tetrahydrodipicolinate reductase
MIGVVVVGAAGRMGCRLVVNVAAAGDMRLAGAVERPDCPALGMDAGLLAGAGELGVPVAADLSAALRCGAGSVIDFSTGNVVENARTAAAAGCAVVIGTTALGAGDKAGLRRLADDGARIVQAFNMSVGMNLLFHLCGQVATVLGEDYDIEVLEMHHNQKKDAPSGSAVRLAEVLAAASGRSYGEAVVHGREGMVGVRPKREIGMHAVRGGDVVGDHTVIFATGGERVELTHKASSRDTFAKGALRAVRFLSTAKPGLYDMQDVLGLR